MCLICVQYESGRLKAKEALRNIEETKGYIDEDHYDETKTFLIEEIAKAQWAQLELSLTVDIPDDEFYEKTGFGD
jgi:hypothetical protein